MAANRIINVGPVAIPAAATNILNVGTGARATPPVGFTDPQFYLILKHIRVTNKSASAVTLSMYKGATGASAAGTEVVAAGTSIPANSYLDWYGIMRFDTADFLVAVAGTVTTLVFQGEGEIGAAG